MAVVANALVLVVAAIHVYILVLEMFLWRTERGRRSFGTDQAFADAVGDARREPGPLQRDPRRRASSGASSRRIRSASR